MKEHTGLVIAAVITALGAIIAATINATSKSGNAQVMVSVPEKEVLDVKKPIEVSIAKERVNESNYTDPLPQRAHKDQSKLNKTSITEEKRTSLDCLTQKDPKIECLWKSERNLL